jgi:GNAT superfamily N-acetyltransferase
MRIRTATEADIPEILKVLKASLGETSSKKSEEIWRYKHIDNPFGRSLVLLAIQDLKIIGVRAFMRWNWQKGEEIFSAFRAVDTATHPEHQGKGVFKKLTLKAVEIVKENGGHFIFNTPNEKSKPGYLKMGWEDIDRLNVGIKFVNPIYWMKPFNERDSFGCINVSEESLELLLQQVSKQKLGSQKYFTPKSVKYLKWRYEYNPLQKYIIRATENYYIAAYVKIHSRFKELRIVEFLINSNTNAKYGKIIVKDLARKSGVQILSFSPKDKLNFNSAVSGKFGPALTLNTLTLVEKDRKDLNDLNSWAYSLGDLELF